ncbi:MAG TPA: DUF1003 domain-containing protein [Gemmatimonadales bacterium]|nr:DUF1003 domain-containing protein [Gemmatimonadales bacterium]
MSDAGSTPPHSATHPFRDRLYQLWPGREPVARDINAEVERRSTLGDRLADRIAGFGGSWPFIIIFLAFLAIWTYLNTAILGPRHEAFDPYPYVFLNLFLSMIAALQAPVILMSQNRQSERDRLAAANDFEVNVRAELAIRALHEQVEVMRMEQMALLRELVESRDGSGSAKGKTHGA